MAKRKRRSLPTITSDIPRDLRRFADRVREIITGDGPDRIPSVSELAGAGIASVDPGGDLVPTQAGASCLPPPAPSTFVASGAMTAVILEWAGTNYPCHSHTEIWRAPVDDVSQAVMVGQSNGGMYADSVGTGGTFYYWVRFRNTQDVAGAFNAVAGTVGTTSPDPEYLIEQLTGSGAYRPMFLVTEPMVINGVTVPAGVYIKDSWIANGSIGNAKIGDAVIDTAKIADAAIVAAKIMDATITGAKIGNAEISTAHIQLAAITAALIEDATITGAKIALATITGANIEAATITTALIEDAAIVTALIEDGAITTAKIGDAQITTAKIIDAQITGAKIANATVTEANIANAAITNAKISNAQITGAKIAGATITDANIGHLSASKVIVGEMSGARISAGTLHGGAVIANTMEADRLIVSTMASRLALIESAYVGEANIENAAITGAKIASAAITDAKITSLNATKLTGDVTTIVPVSAYSGLVLSETDWVLVGSFILPSSSHPQGHTPTGIIAVRLTSSSSGAGAIKLQFGFTDIAESHSFLNAQSTLVVAGSADGKTSFFSSIKVYARRVTGGAVTVGNIGGHLMGVR